MSIPLLSARGVQIGRPLSSSALPSVEAATSSSAASSGDLPEYPPAPSTKLPPPPAEPTDPPPPVASEAPPADPSLSSVVALASSGLPAAPASRDTSDGVLDEPSELHAATDVETTKAKVQSCRFIVSPARALPIPGRTREDTEY